MITRESNWGAVHKLIRRRNKLPELPPASGKYCVYFNPILAFALDGPVFTVNREDVL